MATDDFNRANGSLGANWGNVDTNGGFGEPTITSNAVTGQSGWGNGASAGRYTAATFGADQYSQAVLGGLGFFGADIGAGVIVRASADQDAAKDYYGLRVLDDGASTRTIRIGKYVNGTWTQLTTTTATVGNGDTIRLEVDSTGPANLRAYINGTIVSALTTTDSSLTSGQPGVVATTTATVDNWEGNDLVTSTSAQQGSRFGADDGSESAHTWLAAQDTDVSVAPDTSFRVRLGVQATGDPAAASYQLEWRKVGDSNWTKAE